MDFSLVPQIAQWTTNQLAMLWATPTGNIVLGVTASGVYDVVKRFFRKPAAAGALEEAKAGPRNPDNLAALKVQIAKHLKEDPAFREELLKLVPQELKLKKVTQQQRLGDNSIGTQIVGNQNSVNIKK
jgi:hypothetical protein